MSIRIEYDESAEMMQIFVNEVSVFYGNYWDFDASPSGLQDFLYKCNTEKDVMLVNRIWDDEDDGEIDE